MNILLSFTHPHVGPNLYEFLMLNKKEDTFKNIDNQTVDGLHWLRTVYTGLEQQEGE